MKRLMLQHKRHGNPRPAFSLAEMIVCIALVGMMLVAALNTLGVARQGKRTIGDRSRGLLLAQQLMSEILAKPYDDPDGDEGGMGARGQENTGDRSRFDDVDDFDGWSASPPEDAEGTPEKDLVGWTREVTVARVSTANTTQSTGSESGVKRIVVTVKRGDQVVATLTALRSGDPPSSGDEWLIFNVFTGVSL